MYLFVMICGKNTVRVNDTCVVVKNNQTSQDDCENIYRVVWLRPFVHDDNSYGIHYK